MAVKRSPERVQFLADILVGAVENGGYGGLQAQEWHCPEGQEPDWYAVMYEVENPDVVHRLDLDVIAKGVGVISRAKVQLFRCARAHDHRYCDDGEMVLHNAKTGERLFMSQEMRRNIVAASFENDAAGASNGGDLDVIAYMAVMECGIYGQVVYN